MPSSSRAPRLDGDARLGRLALAGEVLAWSGMALIGISLAWYCADQSRFTVLARRMLPDIPMTITLNAWANGTMIFTLIYGMLALTLIKAARLFALLRHGERFGPKVERTLERLARAVFATALTGIVGKTALGLVLSWANPAHQRQLVLSLSSTDVLALLAAILFLLFALIIAEGRRIDDENRGFI